jgi:hypothetical protein
LSFTFYSEYAWMINCVAENWLLLNVHVFTRVHIVRHVKFSTFYGKIFSLEGTLTGKENISVSCYRRVSHAVLCATSLCMCKNLGFAVWPWIWFLLPQTPSSKD